MYMTVKQAAEKWGISDRRVRILCAEGKISGVIHEGRRWMIPAETGKPADGRFKAAESLLAAIDRKKSELDARRPLTRPLKNILFFNIEFLMHAKNPPVLNGLMDFL